MRRSTTLVAVVLLVLSAVAPAAGAAGVPSVADARATGTADAQASSTVFAAQEAPECSYPLTVSDSTGHEVTIEEEPETVVTLAASAAQTMWEIGAEEKVIGVSMFASYLEGADSREVVLSGRPASVDVETVVSMDPDVVLAPNIIADDSVAQIREAGISVYRFSMATDVQTIYEKTRLMGALVGECAGAENAVAEMRERVQTVENAVGGEDDVSVFYGTEAGFTAGPNTFIGELISKAGGHNIAAEANASRAYFQLSGEFIAEQDPEFVLVSVPPAQLGNEPRSYIPEGSVVRNTTAWEEGNIVVVNTNYLSQPAPRVVRPLSQMAQAFHPEAYAAANTTTTTSTPTTTAESTSAATTAADATSANLTVTDATLSGPTPTDDGETSGGVPGFGLTAAVVAVLGAALLARR